MTMQAHILRAAGAVNRPSMFSTYQDFLSYITEIADYTFSGSGGIPAGNAGGLYRVHSLAKSGSMFGSCWGARFANDSVFNRVIQHGLPSEALMNQQIANSAEILCARENVPNQSIFNALTRNGYASESFDAGSPYPTRACTKLWYWDFSLSKAFEMRPFEQTGPFPWDGTI